MSKHENCGKECKHPSLKFCQSCKVPYCLQCGREWYEKTGWTVRSGGTYDQLPPYIGQGSYTGGYVKETTSAERPENLCKHGK